MMEESKESQAPQAGRTAPGPGAAASGRSNPK